MRVEGEEPKIRKRVLVDHDRGISQTEFHTPRNLQLQIGVKMTRENVVELIHLLEQNLKEFDESCRLEAEFDFNCL